MSSARFPAILLFAVSCILAAFAQQPSGVSDDLAIRRVVDQYMAARNSKDQAAIRRLFTVDADQLVSTGEWRKGVDALVRGAMASSKKEAGSSSITVESIRFIEPDVALVDGRYETSSLNSGAIRRMWTTLLLKRTENRWQIAAIRNMLPAPTRSGVLH